MDSDVKNDSYLSSIIQETTLRKKIAEIFCTLMKAPRTSNFNPVMQSSPCLQNTASQTQLST